MEQKQANKQHRDRVSGRKAERKGRRGSAAGDQSTRGNNPKAFVPQSAVRAAKSARRAADITEKKTHIPVVDRTAVEPPPVVVAVAGPSKVGKSTLIRGLIKHYTRQNVSALTGPLTIVTGKKRRLTLIECQNDINCMIDVSKVADLIVLLIDASYGFEMDTFELLHICQAHGMPKVMGVLTHLDVIPTKERIKQQKKLLKHRFWTEVYQGAKLFYLSGLLNENYLKNEIQNLARFISVMKFRPLDWRTSHPYVLVDRVEDMTEADVVKTDSAVCRTVCLYGYVRGIHLKQHSTVHIPGVGDYQVDEVCSLPDPCALPDQTPGAAKRRSLNEKERTIYAPLCGLGGIVYDKDAVYVDSNPLGTQHKRSLDEALVLEQLSSGTPATAMDTRMAHSQMALLASSTRPAHIEGDDDEHGMHTHPDEQEDESDVDDEYENELNEDEPDSHTDESETVGSRHDHSGAQETLSGWGVEGSGLQQRARQCMNERAQTKPALNWAKLVYSNQLDRANSDSDDGEDATIGGLFRMSRRQRMAKDQRHNDMNSLDCCLFVSPAQLQLPFESIDQIDMIRDCLVTGQWTEEEDATALLQADDRKVTFAQDNESESDSDDDEEEKNEKDEDRSGGEGDAALRVVHDQKEVSNNRRSEKKMKLKQMFDAEYDETSTRYHDHKEQLDTQAKLNRAVFDKLDVRERVCLEGHRPGTYVRCLFKALPAEFIKHFDPKYPYLVGGLLTSEQNVGIVQVRLKRHRWFPRVLKTRDPLIVSLGWRRFQTMVMYTQQDHNMRQRLLKYTPEHMHCHAVFYGPITPQNASFVAVQSVADLKVKHFRVAATGVVLNLDKSLQIVKKLKLIGHPYKIFKKSAFIKDMFNNRLEVAKFEGALLRTVSGLRGQIKKALSAPEGCFRATFEDKILLRDIVCLRTWYTVTIPEYYAPVTNLLMAAPKLWTGMRTVGQMRFEHGLKPPTKGDSLYRGKIVRTEFEKEELVVPRQLQQQLPFKFKPKQSAAQTVSDVEPLVARHTAVVLEPHETKMNKLMGLLRMVKAGHATKQQAKMHERMNKREEHLQEEQTKRAKRMHETKKLISRKLSQGEQKKLKHALKMGKRSK